MNPIKNFEDLSIRYRDVTFDSEWIELIDALLHGASQPRKVADTSVKTRKYKNPFDNDAELPTMDVEGDSNSHESLLAEAVEVMTLIFRLDGRHEIAGRISLLIEKIRERTNDVASPVQNELKELKYAIDKIRQMEEEIVFLKKNHEEREKEIEDKQIEIHSLRGRIAMQKDREAEILRERNVFTERLTELQNLEQEIEKLRGEVSKHEAEAGKLQGELEQHKKTLASSKGVETDIKKRINESKTKYATTQNLLLELKANPFFDPDVLQKIQDVWQTLPNDKLDLEIKRAENKD